jgi:hypothetical protein
MENNTTGTVALGTGIGVIVVQLLMVCTGLIPFVNFINLLLFPLVLILDVVAIVTGVMGMKKAKLLNGLGKGPSIAGLVIGVVHLVLILGALVLALIIGGATFLMGMMS